MMQEGRSGRRTGPARPDAARRSDPQFLELRRRFVREAVDDARELERILRDAGDSLPEGEAGLRFRKLAHDLRGSGGSYGFPVVSLHAGDAEDTYVEEGSPEALRALVAMLAASLDDAGRLVGLSG